MTELESSPSLTRLYARAMIARSRHGAHLPDTELVLRDQVIDRDHLTAYQRLCGFRVQDALPPTYLYVLAFPLAVAAMVQPGFPLALPGMVHIANVIEQRRPVSADEAVSLRVHAADLREHESGRQVDLLADATVGDEVVWRSRSTYLRREQTARSSGPRPVADALSGPVALIRVPADAGRRYAAISGDRNPIHLYPLTARAFGFPRAIAHGMWLKARVLATLAERLPDALSVDVAFKAPVLLPSTVSIIAVPRDARWLLDVRNAKSGRPHLSGLVSMA